MTTSDGSSANEDSLLQQAIRDELLVHVRVSDQDHALDDEDRLRLSRLLPGIKPFAGRTFHSIRVIVDWDHQLPSQYVILRIIGCYEESDTLRVNNEIETRLEEIDDGNLFPEFDLLDFSDIEGNETYAAVMRPGSTEIEDFRFLSGWRKFVEPHLSDEAVRIVQDDKHYQFTINERASVGLGGPVVIGWSPPCLSNSEDWTVEVWLLTEFDGQSGRARVFMVDLDQETVTREFDTDVQLS